MVLEWVGDAADYRDYWGVVDVCGGPAGLVCFLTSVVGYGAVFCVGMGFEGVVVGVRAG